MKIVCAKKYFKNGNGWSYEFQHDKIDRYCCKNMKKMIRHQYDPFTILDSGELVIESYDFDTIRPINFCVCCGEKIELEILD